MTQYFLNYTVDVYRFIENASKEQYGNTPAITNLEVCILPMDAAMAALAGSGESAFQMYDVYIYTDAVIHSGDKLISGTDEWIVKGVPQKFTSLLQTYSHVQAVKVI